jgi:glutamate-5-semialdehyde dehydrogenase
MIVLIAKKEEKTMMDLHQMSAAARKAFYTLAVSDHDIRNRALIRMSDLLKLHKEEVFHANSEDLRQAEQDGLSSPLLHRLKFGEEKLHQVCDGLVALTSLRDPIGRCTLATEITDGLILRRITCPIGVIGVIFESRPDALIQILLYV